MKRVGIVLMVVFALLAFTGCSSNPVEPEQIKNAPETEVQIFTYQTSSDAIINVVTGYCSEKIKTILLRTDTLAFIHKDNIFSARWDGNPYSVLVKIEYANGNCFEKFITAGN